MSKKAQKPERLADEADAGCRLDIWLFRARFVKSRKLASTLITKGKIRVSHSGKTERVKKPHFMLRPGHQVTFMRGNQLITAQMISAGTRRGPAPEAQSLYRLLTSGEEHAKSRA